jgi:hypothetical protein
MRPSTLAGLDEELHAANRAWLIVGNCRRVTGASRPERRDACHRPPSPAALYSRAMNELLRPALLSLVRKARWALDVRVVPYRYRHCQPLIGELELRLKTRRLRGK